MLIVIDATLLSETELTIPGLPGTFRSVPAQQVELPAGFWSVLGANSGQAIPFEVRQDGNVDYDKKYDVVMAGRGTPTIAVLGNDGQIQARLREPLFNVYGAGGGAIFRNELASGGKPIAIRLLPGAYYLRGAASGLVISFTVDSDGNFQYDPRLEGSLLGAGTNVLTINNLGVPAEPPPPPPPPPPPGRGQPTANVPITVVLDRTSVDETRDLPLWGVIRNRTEAISFNRYRAFIDKVMCRDDLEAPDRDNPQPAVRIAQGIATRYGATSQPLSRSNAAIRAMPMSGGDAYNLLKIATEVFVAVNCGVVGDFSFLESLPPNENRPKVAGLFTDADLADERVRRANPGLTRLGLEQSWEGYLVDLALAGSSNDQRDMLLPYLELIRLKLSDVPVRDDSTGPSRLGIKCQGILRSKLVNPCLLELIWSYWHEEAMLVQSLNVISRRFQNRRNDRALGGAGPDPLAELELDVLRPMNNLLWGYVQDEQHRLSLARRAYEYDHHYGFSLQGKAVPTPRTADSRTGFLRSFHDLLRLCADFYHDDDDTTVKADPFPIRNALREMHFLLAYGAHNQYGDLPSVARQEMLAQMWLLARPEMREFLGGRVAVPYPEDWMDRVDVLRKRMEWSDSGIDSFRTLASSGERVLLSVRFGSWSDPSMMPAQAAQWARYWRPEILGYLHSYREATGVDLTRGTDATPPSVHLVKRMAGQRARR